MRFNVYTIYDKISCTFCPPFLCVSDEHAERFVKDELCVSGSMLSKYPGDYELFFVCKWQNPDPEKILDPGQPGYEPFSPVVPDSLRHIIGIKDLLNVD